MLPLARSMVLLRSRGYSVGKTEYRNIHVHVTHDLFNFADLVAIRGDKPGVTAIQSTTIGHQADRFRKITGIPEARVWLNAGNRIVVHGWSQNARTKRWACTERDVRLSDLQESTQHDAPTTDEEPHDDSATE